MQRIRKLSSNFRFFAKNPPPDPSDEESNTPPKSTNLRHSKSVPLRKARTMYRSNSTDDNPSPLPPTYKVTTHHPGSSFTVRVSDREKPLPPRPRTNTNTNLLHRPVDYSKLVSPLPKPRRNDDSNRPDMSSSSISTSTSTMQSRQVLIRKESGRRALAAQNTSRSTDINRSRPSRANPDHSTLKSSNSRSGNLKRQNSRSKPSRNTPSSPPPPCELAAQVSRPRPGQSISIQPFLNAGPHMVPFPNSSSPQVIHKQVQVSRLVEITTPAASTLNRRSHRPEIVVCGSDMTEEDAVNLAIYEPESVKPLYSPFAPTDRRTDKLN